MAEIKYKLTAYYVDGDSFGSYDQTEVISDDCSLEICEENKRRISEHYKWYEHMDRHEWSKEKKMQPPEWWNPKRGIIDDSLRSHAINLLAENGEEYTILCPWIGYFEHLETLEITPCSYIEGRFREEF